MNYSHNESKVETSFGVIEIKITVFENGTKIIAYERYNDEFITEFNDGDVTAYNREEMEEIFGVGEHFFNFWVK